MRAIARGAATAARAPSCHRVHLLRIQHGAGCRCRVPSAGGVPVPVSISDYGAALQIASGGIERDSVATVCRLSASDTAGGRRRARRPRSLRSRARKAPANPVISMRSIVAVAFELDRPRAGPGLNGLGTVSHAVAADNLEPRPVRRRGSRHRSLAVARLSNRSRPMNSSSTPQSCQWAAPNTTSAPLPSAAARS